MTNPSKFSVFDPVEFLESEEDIKHYMEEAVATGDEAFIAECLANVEKAKTLKGI